uniref:Protein Mis18-alpha n=1 Tax=Scleropages formosus TaxID=113540 RepID=A0A8C9R5J8_SCLFO
PLCVYVCAYDTDCTRGTENAVPPPHLPSPVGGSVFQRSSLHNVELEKYVSISSLSHFGSHCKVSGESESDAPAVFQCGTCRLPVGDSLSWAGSEEEHNQILLSRTTDNVVVGTEPLFSRTQVELGCVIVNLTCRGCSTLLGQVYTSTPKSLDYKRSLFCFNVESIDCYVLGSSEQTMLLNAQEKPVTLEYREAMELQMEQVKKPFSTCLSLYYT